VQTSFPQQGSRLGVVQFSTGVETVVEFDDGGSPATWASAIRGMPQMQGATYMKRAFSYAYFNMWEPNRHPTRRSITMIVTDGEPNPTSQNPCEWAQRYLDEGIEIIGVAIGITKEQFGFDCLDQENSIPVVEIADFGESNIAATQVFSLVTSCDAGGAVVTPFNGGYSVIPGSEHNGKPIYAHSENWFVQWEHEVWMFVDPTGLRKSMTQSIHIDTPWPVRSDWVWESTEGFYTEYRDVLVCCSDTRTPTRMPSDCPTVTPSHVPSKSPTKNPTQPPQTSQPTTHPITSEPSTQPTISSPSKSPSDFPSSSPVTSNPSTTPTHAPTHPPSNSPTKNPTFSGPSISPSFVPSRNPSLNPSKSPTFSTWPLSGSLIVIETVGTTTLPCAGSCTPLVDLVERTSESRMRITGQGEWFWSEDIMYTAPYNFIVQDPILLDNPQISLACAVSNGVGTMPKAAVDDIVIVCSPGVYFVSGHAYGAQGTVEIALNAPSGDDRYLTSATGFGVNDNVESFSFGGPIIMGLAYNVTIVSNPPGQGCYVVNGDGISAVNVTNVEVHCYNTDDPTVTPSDMPSRQPVAAPSYGPSVTPSFPPSFSPTIFVSKAPSVEPTRGPTDPPCPCLSDDPLSIGMDSMYIIPDESFFINDVLTICFSVPEYYDIYKIYLLKDEPDMGAAYPNATYWTIKNDNTTCRATICMTYTWHELLGLADMQLVERRDTLYYQGIVDVTIDDCYPDIDRRICWQFPFALELPTTTTVCTDAVTVVGGDPHFRDAVIVKLGQYLPTPYAVQVRVILRTEIENPWRLAGDAKIRPSDELIAEGLTAVMVGEAQIVDVHGCDYDAVGTYCVQEIEVLWDLNAMCEITGNYWLDATVRASGNENSDVPISLQLELGLDPSCPQTLGSLPLAGALLSYETAELINLKQEFDVYEKAYFLLTIDSVRQIASSEITQIQLKQGDVAQTIFYKGQAVGWGTDPSFGFSYGDGRTDSEKTFEFILEPDYISALLTGTELVVCVDAEVTFLGGTRTRMRMLFEVDDDGEMNTLILEQPLYVKGGNNIQASQSTNLVLSSDMEETSTAKATSPFLIIGAGLTVLLLCSLITYCTYSVIFEKQQIQTTTYEQVTRSVLRKNKEVAI